MSVIGEKKDEKIEELENRIKELKNELDWVKIQLKCINEHIMHLYNFLDETLDRDIKEIVEKSIEDKLAKLNMEDSDGSSD